MQFQTADGLAQIRVLRMSKLYSCAEMSRHPVAELTLRRAKARAPERGIHAASTAVVLGNVENFMRVSIALGKSLASSKGESTAPWAHLTPQASRKYFPLPTTKEWGEGQGEGKSDDQSLFLEPLCPLVPRGPLLGWQGH